MISDVGKCDSRSVPTSADAITTSDSSAKTCILTFSSHFRLLFKLPRVCLSQKEKFEEEDVFKKHAREAEVRYTLYRDRPSHERQAKFQAGCRDGHTEIVSISTWRLSEANLSVT